MIDGRGQALITDFGLAIATGQTGSNSEIVGTPGYVAPELLSGAPAQVQSDIYALGLVLYELFTGKKAFEACSTFSEFRRIQSENSPRTPSNLVSGFDPAVERAILQCLQLDPSLRPQSALSVSAILPGGDPLGAALAAGQTPSPQMVAAAGPEGCLRPEIAWAALAAALVVIAASTIFLSPKVTNWGLASPVKSPEVLADRAHELAQKNGYSESIDSDFWLDSEYDYLDYMNRNGRSVWPSPENANWQAPIAFWYRQSPQWMTPERGADGFPGVTAQNPPYDLGPRYHQAGRERKVAVFPRCPFADADCKALSGT